MKKIKNRLIFTILMCASLILLSGCGTNGDQSDSKGKVNLGYVEWDSEVASTHVIAQVLTDLGYQVELTPLDNAIMWEALAKGEIDATVSAWLPDTHGEQMAQFKDRVELLGVNLPTAKIGLVVPAYMEINSIEELKDQANQTIIGVEPGAGVVIVAEEALKEYPNLADWTVDSSSSAVMTIALKQAIEAKEEIVVTGWSPHWIFDKYELKYLADPAGAFGEAETINTIARQDLKEDLPDVYQVLKRFEWTEEEMAEVLIKINAGVEPKKAAQEFIESHPDLVQSWLN